MRSAFVIILASLLAGLAAPEARGGLGSGSGGHRRHGNLSPAAMLRMEIRQAQSELNRAIAEARRAFVASTQFVTAVDEMRRAGRDYRAARDAALVGLRGSSDYATAKLEIDHLQRELDGLRRANAPLSQVVQLSRMILERRGALARLEMDVLKSDAHFAYARYAWIDAAAAVAAMWRDLDQAVRHDPACLAARQKVAAARERLASLND